MPFEFEPQSIPDLVLVKPRVFADERGWFLESYKESEFVKAGIRVNFRQANHSQSSRGVVRGLHYQLPPFEQGKLVRVLQGAVWDVAVDVRPNSASFGKWLAVELSEQNHFQFWIPGGFAHGFVALTDNAHLEYYCTNEYNQAAEAGIRWDDPDLSISWPISDTLVSAKDKLLPNLRQAKTFPENYRTGALT